MQVTRRYPSTTHRTSPIRYPPTQYRSTIILYARTAPGYTWGRETEISAKVSPRDRIPPRTGASASSLRACAAPYAPSIRGACAAMRAEESIPYALAAGSVVRCHV
eukprot:2352228-Rhodomonas_salina.3